MKKSTTEPPYGKQRLPFKYPSRHPIDPLVKERIFRLTEERDDRRFLAKIFARVPCAIATPFLNQYAARLKKQGRRAANLYALDLHDGLLLELLPETGLPFDATDHEIVEEAWIAAKRVAIKAVACEGEAELLAALGRIAHHYDVRLPCCAGTPAIFARMRTPAWWRRALRKRFQRLEHAAIAAGLVHKHASLYLSPEALRRFDRHQARMKELLAACEAVNLATGEVLSLEELSQGSLANPAHRRAAMMVCVRGLDAYARERGFEGFSITITCPSRMHARYEESGAANPAYDPKHSPRVAQNYLGRLWNNAQRKLEREGIRNFGLRTVEPHHDGTPHWHVIVFVEPSRAARLIEILREYALRDSPDEPGAAECRFKVEKIDPAKGDAVAYIAAYISKNTDGYGLGDDPDSAKNGARRAVAWARLWGVRQFQFFGTGAITPYRELYRVKQLATEQEPLIGGLLRAVHAKDFRQYLVARDAAGVRLALHYESRPSARYPGEETKRPRGIVCQRDGDSLLIITRADDWIIRPRGADEKTDGTATSALRFNRRRDLPAPSQLLLDELEPMTGHLDYVGGQGAPTSMNGASAAAFLPPPEPDLWLKGEALERWKKENPKEAKCWFGESAGVTDAHPSRQLGPDSITPRGIDSLMDFHRRFEPSAQSRFRHAVPDPHMRTSANPALSSCGAGSRAPLDTRDACNIY